MNETKLEILEVVKWENNFKVVAEYLDDIWDNHYGVYKFINDNELELHTGGWSINEDIINELECTMFWFFYWQKSERGGHYYFKKEN